MFTRSSLFAKSKMGRYLSACLTSTLPLGLMACQAAPGPKAVDLAATKTQCFKTVTVPVISLKGDVFRRAGLVSANTIYNAAQPRSPTTPPPVTAACTAPAAPLPAFDPAHYYGTISNKKAFLQIVSLPCGVGAPANQFFSLGKESLYYRNCTGGVGNGYVYFWGRQDGNKSTCFGGAYPEMWDAAKKKMTVSEMKAVYNGGLTKADTPSFAHGNIMAALLIAESWRDYLVILENYMLVDMADANTITTEQIASGMCIPGATSCQNSKSKKNGRHPLAWGGAQSDMMTGGWGQNNGATSAFGEEYEAGLVVKWLTEKGHIKPDKTNGCRAGNTFHALSPATQNRLLGWYKPLFP